MTKQSTEFFDRNKIQFRQTVPVVCFGLFVSVATATGQPTDSEHDLSDIVVGQGVDVSRSALIIRRLGDGTEWTAGNLRLDDRFPPASSSKIPHTLIALETGIADGSDAPFVWDGIERHFASWNQDQTLASAFSRSAVWVYQQITTELGRQAMSDWLTRFDYGNHDVGGQDDLTTYWLRGPLEISAREQADFLESLASRHLPVSQRTYDIAEIVMRANGGEDWTLYAKTGWRHDGINIDIGWYVGWLETVIEGDAETFVFAFNMDMPNPSEDLDRRLSTVHTALVEIGALPISATE